MKTSAILTLCCCVVTFVSAESHAPPSRYVPDSATVVQIAEAVLDPVYGKKKIESERPFTAKLENEVWTVSGTLHCADGKGGTTTHCVGGTAVVQISQRDGHIISMRHYK